MIPTAISIAAVWWQQATWAGLPRHGCGVALTSSRKSCHHAVVAVLGRHSRLKTVRSSSMDLMITRSQISPNPEPSNLSCVWWEVHQATTCLLLPRRAFFREKRSTWNCECGMTLQIVPALRRFMRI